MNALCPDGGRVGLSPAMSRRIDACAATVALPRGLAHVAAARVVEVQRSGVRLHDGVAETPARVWPALHAALRSDDDALTVGDWVLTAGDVAGARWAVALVARRGLLARRDVEGRGRQTLAANVDTALLATGLGHDFNLRRLERYLAFVRMAGVDAVVVLTKADLAADVPSRLAQVRARLRPGEDVVAVDARDPASAAALQPWLARGRTLVLLGSSGVGKSTLTNALAGLGADPSRAQATGGVRAGDERGRHTTTARTLHLTPHGACLIDTPGLRTLRLDGDEQALRASFDDIGALAECCRFRDCRHDGEPGCAVREAVDARRIANYDKLQRELRRDTLSALERREVVRRFKVRARASRARRAAGGR